MLITCRRLEGIADCMKKASAGCSEELQTILNDGMVEQVGLFLSELGI